MASKYEIAPKDIFKMNEKELKTYIRGAYKSIESKIRRTAKSEYADFSELLSEADWIAKRWGQNKISSATKGLNKWELQRRALDLASLFRITETPAQLEQEGFNNIKNFFKEPRFTKAFIEGIRKNRKILAKIANKNDTFIHDILPSEQIRAIMSSEGEDEDKYAELLQAVSDELDLYDNEEKEALINDRWDPVFESVGDNVWRDNQTGEIMTGGRKNGTYKRKKDNTKW